MIEFLQLLLFSSLNKPNNLSKEHGGSACTVTLTSNGNKDNDNKIYDFHDQGGEYSLKTDSSFTVSYTVKTTLDNKTYDVDISGISGDFSQISTFLGKLQIDWKPALLHLPIKDTKLSFCDLGYLHGPLPSRSSVSFHGPRCNIESVPFDASLLSFPSNPKVATPFEVVYRVRNKTSLNQKLNFHMNETFVENQGDGILVSGMVTGEIMLGPSESKEFGYSALAIRSGKSLMPALTLDSVRYQSSVINETKKPRYCFVLP